MQEGGMYDVTSEISISQTSPPFPSFRSKQVVKCDLCVSARVVKELWNSESKEVSF